MAGCKWLTSVLPARWFSAAKGLAKWSLCWYLSLATIGTMTSLSPKDTLRSRSSRKCRACECYSVSRTFTENGFRRNVICTVPSASTSPSGALSSSAGSSVRLCP